MNLITLDTIFNPAQPQEKTLLSLLAYAQAQQSSWIFIDFYADWCGPCKRLAPIIEKIAQDNTRSDLMICKIDIEHPAGYAISALLNIKSLPTLCLFHISSPRPVATLLGFQSEAQLKEWIETHTSVDHS